MEIIIATAVTLLFILPIVLGTIETIKVIIQKNKEYKQKRNHEIVIEQLNKEIKAEYDARHK